MDVAAMGAVPQAAPAKKPERSIYAAGGGRKFAFAFVFLILLPFFISRDPGIPDPGLGGDAGGITWIELAGDAARLERWLDRASLPVRVVDGPPAVRAVGIGQRELR